MQELAFSIRAAKLSGATLVFRPYASERDMALSTDLKKYFHASYEWANSVLGLTQLFRELGAIVSSQPAAVAFKSYQLASPKCQKVLFAKIHGGANTSDNTRCCNLYFDNLGVNPWNEKYELAQAQFAECARVASPILGTWMNFDPFAQDAAVVKVVIHVRRGDLQGKWPTYTFLFDALAPIFRMYQSSVYVIGGGDKENKRDGEHEVGKSISAILSSLNLTTTVRTPFTSPLQAFLFMMHADVLVSSGSSFCQAAVTFSPKPVFVAHYMLKGSVGVDTLKNTIEVNGATGKLTLSAKTRLWTQLLLKLWKRGVRLKTNNEMKHLLPAYDEVSAAE